MERPSYAPDLPVRGENALRATSGNRLPGALIAGALAGPILIVSSFVQGLVRDGFQFAADPPSALALGSAGVIQQATFVVSGLLLARGGWGLRGLGFGRWVPRLLVVLGTSLAAAGVFRMDPAFGFPPGTPPGIGASVSWHAAIHGVLFPIGFLALVGAAVIAGRRYAKEGRAGMFWVTCLAAGLSLTLSLWPNLAGNPDGRFGPMWVGITIGYAWTSLLFADAIRSRRKTHVR